MIDTKTVFSELSECITSQYKKKFIFSETAQIKSLTEIYAHSKEEAEELFSQGVGTIIDTISLGGEWEILEVKINEKDYKRLYKNKFSINGEKDMPIYEAVDFYHTRWNGWLRPIVTQETAQQIAKDIFNHDDPSDNEPYQNIILAIQESKENFETTVEVGCGLIWDFVEEEA